MAYTLNIIEQPGYLHFQVSGRNTLATVRGYLAEVHAICARRGSPSVLLEENLSGASLTIGEIFQNCLGRQRSDRTRHQFDRLRGHQPGTRFSRHAVRGNRCGDSRNQHSHV